MRHSCVWVVGFMSLFLVLGCDSGGGGSEPVPGSGTVETGLFEPVAGSRTVEIDLCQGQDDCEDENFCQGQGDCGDESACVQAGGASVCQLNCSLNADLCGAQASCTGVGAVSMSVNVCQPAPEEETQAELVPEEQPTLPCSTEEDCQQFSAIAICALFEGVRDCTIPCAEEKDCEMPTVMGVSMDFLTCIPDEGNTNRKACLPDKACWDKPTDCMGGLDDFMNMGGDGEEEDMDGDMSDEDDLDPFSSDLD